MANGMNGTKEQRFKRIATLLYSNLNSKLIKLHKLIVTMTIHFHPKYYSEKGLYFKNF